VSERERERERERETILFSGTMYLPKVGPDSFAELHDDPVKV